MSQLTKLLPGQRTCPKCNSNWDGDSIVETFINQRNTGSKHWAGKSDEEIKESVEGWSAEKIDQFIADIQDPAIKEEALKRRQLADNWPLTRLLSKHFDVFILGTYGPPYKWGREIGIELPYDHPKHYDGVSYWQCPDCKTLFDRFTGIEEPPPLVGLLS